LAYPAEHDDLADDPEDLGMLMGIIKTPREGDLDQAVAEYLRPRVGQGEPEYIVEDTVAGCPALRTEWTDGVNFIVAWWVEAPDMRFLVEYSNDTRMQVVPLEQARACIQGLRLASRA
jgi:hypothetical protein